MKNYFTLLKRLYQADVSFVLVGGFAAATYGCTLFTQDITPERIIKVQDEKQYSVSDLITFLYFVRKGYF
ncbi:MAG: hypothetical protein FJ263_06355 [Planctomycetes bacterium]|nr:hypothetical protein [Planctomycetota bacterium]